MFYYTHMKEIITAIRDHGDFRDNKILRPHLTDRRGIRMYFPEGSQCILWTNGKKYYARCEAFGALFNINIPRGIGDTIWGKFLDKFEGNYIYEDF